MDDAVTKAVTERLLSWYGRHYRPLPWRQDPTPYRVWISEIMLQQTRIEAVLPYYERFMSALPDVAALATVSEDTLLKLWEGLGYYSRARNLQKAARLVMEEHAGVLPADYDRLLTSVISSPALQMMSPVVGSITSFKAVRPKILSYND